MGMTSHELHVVFLPFLASGHIIPTVDIARLFAAQGVRVTVIATPVNAQRFQNVIDRDAGAGRDIKLETVRFPCTEAGLPEGCENVSNCTTPGMSLKFLNALNILRPQLESLLRQMRPDCILSDALFPWTLSVAAELGIPRVSFSASGFFSRAINHALEQHKPHMKPGLDERDPFVVPSLPDQIVLTRSQIPEHLKRSIQHGELFDEMIEAEKKSFGVVVNSFEALEPSYADYCGQAMGMKTWQVGPSSLFHKDEADKAERGNKDSVGTHTCLAWLDSMKSSSVLYVCFGSLVIFTEAQLTELAAALEDSGRFFIWVVPKVLKQNMGEVSPNDEWWLPEGLEERVEKTGKGMIIKGWAPQVMILEHPAIGGFLTHCGWNSLIENAAAGLPMISWPMAVDQFYIEKIVTQLLKFGVSVGNEDFAIWPGDMKLVGREKIREAVCRVMSNGEEAEEMRKIARKLAVSAKRAVEEGGSSYNDLKSLIQDIKSYHQN